MERKRYLVIGMSCEHCAGSIRKELGEVPGVAHVGVDLATDTVLVDGENLDDALLRAAITGAGYEVAEAVTA
ncbi:heavy-metal-associated domain-containing protein [Streptomyces sp. NPDC048187]|uniref:heavy-metal-associated domain-containing protein n=1 Tax=Streptomyces sp. NPDC048187 TaxID=3365509 RepID=UPI00370F98C9